jgi:hypothetical protein
MRLITRNPWTSQPRVPVGPNSAFAIERLINGAFQHPADLAKNAPITWLGGAIPSPRKPGVFGVGLNNNSAVTNGVVTVPSWTNTTNEASFCLVLHPPNGASDKSIWEFGSASGDEFPFSGQAYFDVGWSSRWALAVNAPSGATFGDPVVLVFTVKNGEQKAYWNGKLWVSNTLTGGFTLPSTLTFSKQVTGGGCVFFAGAAASRAWNAVEAASIGQNPWQLFAPLQRTIWVPASAGGGNTAALTGQTATGTQGTPVASLSLATTGNSSTATQGAVTAALSLAITGNSATGTQGTVTPSLSIALTGNSVTSTAGTVTASIPGGVGLTGNSSTATQGTPVAELSLALTGNSATATQGTVTSSVGQSVALTGQTATATQGTPVAALSVALTGNSATATAGIVDASSSGGTITVALTGNTITATAGLITFPDASGGDGGEVKKPNKFYIRRKGKILLFDTAEQADDYLEAEEEAQKAITAAKSRGAKKRIAAKILKTVEPVESVEIAPLQELVKAYSVPVNLPQLLTQQDYQQVMDVRAMIQRIQDDEDDELLLLLA